MSQGKERADLLVFRQGLAESKEQARRAIMAGEIYYCPPGADPVDPPTPPNWLRVIKAGHPYPSEARFYRVGPERFVSRGAYKLLTLLEYTGLDVTGLVCLDAGASTGGFTDCLLQRGAARVYALDVGHHQLHEKLREDPRVISHEGVNLRNPARDLVPEPVDLMVCDVSFISVTRILPSCLPWMRQAGRIMVLIKPQFELGPHETVRGIVKDESLRKKACTQVVRFCEETLDLTLEALVPSKVKGAKGNQEFMASFVRRVGQA